MASLIRMSTRVSRSGKRTSTSSTSSNSTSKPSKRKKTSAMSSLVNDLKSEYSKNRDAEYAVEIKRYMRGQFENYGLKAPVRRAIDKSVTANFLSLSSENLCDLFKLCWNEDKREFQYFACDMAKLYAAKTDKITGSDIDSCMENLEVVKFMIMTKSWWDTVDVLAPHVVGKMMKKHPEPMAPILDDWIQSENIWLKRSAILHQLTYNKETDKQRLFRYCSLCLHEEEFFIRKAIGWALREFHKHDPKAVKKYVKENESKMSKLSQREALKHA